MEHGARAEPAPCAGDTDEQLADRVRASGDEAAFAELVHRYQGKVFKLAVSVLGQPFAADAEDVVQDVMVRVHHGLRTYRGEARFGSWLYRIALNQALNVKARTRYRAPHVGEEALDQAPSGDRPDDQLHAARRRRAVAIAVGELPDVYQSALRLHYWLGASVNEIAVMLGAPENTVKSYLYRARQLLHAKLAERGFDAR